MRMTYNDVIEPMGVGQIITNTYNITVEACYVYQDLGHDCHLGGSQQRMGSAAVMPEKERLPRQKPSRI
jgi:hypothetical protein